jgi:snurportin-1
MKDQADHTSSVIMKKPIKKQTEIPNDLNGTGSVLGSGWLVRPRPEGKRCMVIANDGKTWSRQLDGNILHRF